MRCILTSLSPSLALTRLAPSKGQAQGSLSKFRHPLPHLPSSSVQSPKQSTDDHPKSLGQICKRGNHQALDCFNRMNHAFQGRHPLTELAAMVTEANTTYLSQH